MYFFVPFQFQRSSHYRDASAAAIAQSSTGEDVGMPLMTFATTRGYLIMGALALLALAPQSATAQESGTVTGTVTRAGEGSELASVSVTVQGT